MGLVLGVSGSLRNAQFGARSAVLIDEINSVGSTEGLTRHLEAQTKIRFDDFIQIGRDRELPFDQIHRNLCKVKGGRTRMLTSLVRHHPIL